MKAKIEKLGVDGYLYPGLEEFRKIIARHPEVCQGRKWKEFSKRFFETQRYLDIAIETLPKVSERERAAIYSALARHLKEQRVFLQEYTEKLQIHWYSMPTFRRFLDAFHNLFPKPSMDGPLRNESYCFPDNAYLKTREGGPVTFNQLSEMFQRGEKFPEIAAFDEVTGEVVYQKPELIVTHFQIQSSLLYLDAHNTDQTTTLEVTPNHRLWILRGGLKMWLEAGQLGASDQLINPFGESYSIDSLRTVQGVFNLYNLSFLSNKTGLHPTYLVSADGQSWFVTHNFKMLG